MTLQALATGRWRCTPSTSNTSTARSPASRGRSGAARDAYRAGQRYALAHGLELLDPTPFSDTDAIGVTVGYALANHLQSLADLDGSTPADARRAAGVPAEPTGCRRLEHVYGVSPAAFTPLAVGTQYPALDQGTVQAAEVQTTDGQLLSGDYPLLADPADVFGWGNVVPVASAQALDGRGAGVRGDDQPGQRAAHHAADARAEPGGRPRRAGPGRPSHQQFLETHGLIPRAVDRDG